MAIKLLADRRPPQFEALAPGHRSAARGLCWLGAWLVIGANVTRAGDLRYTYDEAARLVGVLDAATQQGAEYRYDAAGNLTRIVPAGPVAIFAFAPGAGPIDSTVAVQGKGFAPTPAGNTVRFNGTPAQVLTAAPEQLVVRVPAGASSGPIQVATAAGTANSAHSFFVSASRAPMISAFNPLIGVPGGTLTIDGARFETALGNNRVAVNQGFPARITEASPTRLVATLPANATSGRVRVATPYGEAVAAADHFVVRPPHQPADVAVARRTTLDTPEAVALPAGKIGLLVFDPPADGPVALNVSGSLTGGSGNQAAIGVRQPDGSVALSRSKGTSDLFLDKIALTPPSNQLSLVPGAGYSGTLNVEVVSVYSPQLTAALTLDGGEKSLATTKAGQNVRFTFNNSVPNQRVSLQLTAARASGSGTSTAYRLVWPNGQIETSSSAVSSAYIDARTLGPTGQWTLEIDPPNTSVGSYSARIDSVPPDATGTLVVDGPALTLTTTKAGQNARFSLDNTVAGQRIAFTLDTELDGGGGVLTYYSLIRPDGTMLVNREGYGGIQSEFTVRTLDATGVWTLLLDHEHTGYGRFYAQAASVLPDVTGTLALNAAPTPVTITKAGQNAQFTFSFANPASQSVTVRVSGNTIGSLGVEARLKSGTTTLARRTSGNANFSLDPQTLAAATVYTVEIDPVRTGTGSLNIQVTTP